MIKNIDELIKVTDNYEKLATKATNFNSIDKLLEKTSEYLRQALETQSKDNLLK
jgi:hypothetical protein